MGWKQIGGFYLFPATGKCNNKILMVMSKRWRYEIGVKTPGYLVQSLHMPM